MGRTIITTDVTNEDRANDLNLRPQHFEDYIGQNRIKENLKVYIDASLRRRSGF